MASGIFRSCGDLDLGDAGCRAPATSDGAPALGQCYNAFGGRGFARAAQLEALGFKAADALHVAAAESAGAAALLSCDDRMCRLAARRRGQIVVRVLNPLKWLQEQSDASDT